MSWRETALYCANEAAKRGAGPCGRDAWCTYLEHLAEWCNRMATEEKLDTRSMGGAGGMDRSAGDDDERVDYETGEVL